MIAKQIKEIYKQNIENFKTKIIKIDPESIYSKNLKSRKKEKKMKKNKIINIEKEKIGKEKIKKLKKNINIIESNKFDKNSFCYCKKYKNGKFLSCDYQFCNIRWFHLDCVGFFTLPKYKWYCKDCENPKNRI